MQLCHAHVIEISCSTFIIFYLINWLVATTSMHMRIAVLWVIRNFRKHVNAHTISFTQQLVSPNPLFHVLKFWWTYVFHPACSCFSIKTFGSLMLLVVIANSVLRNQHSPTMSSYHNRHHHRHHNNDHDFYPYCLLFILILSCVLGGSSILR